MPDKSNILNLGRKLLYEINISGAEWKKGDRKRTLDGVLWTDARGQSIIKKIFEILKNELRIFKFLKPEQNEVFARVKNFLHSDFYRTLTERKDLKEKNLEDVIEKELNRLKEFKFIVDYDMEKDEMIKITPDELKDYFLNLRKQRISVLEAVLKDYKERKFDYDKVLGALGYP